MRKRIIPSLILVLLVCVIAVVFFYISKYSQEESNKAETKFNIKPISKTNDFAGPVKDVLGVTFQHSFDLQDGASFSDVGIYDVIVKSVSQNEDSGYLEVTKDDKTLLLPLVGVLSLKNIEEESYEPVNVKDLSSIIGVGDLLTVHLIYVSPLSTYSTKQIREKLLENPQGEIITDEARLWVASITNTGLTENKILSILNESNQIKFNSDQMTVHLIEVKSK